MGNQINMKNNKQLDFELPSDLESERLVLGAALSGSEAFSLIAGILQAEDFSVEKHRRIFLCLSELMEQGLEPSASTVALELRKRDQLDSCDGLSYLATIADLPRLGDTLAVFCDRVKEMSLRSELIRASQAAIEGALTATFERGETLVELERMMEIANASTGRQISAQTVEEIIQDEGGFNTFLSPEKTPGVSIPFPLLNKTLRGLRPSKLIILGARPAVGKTAKASQIAERAAADGKNVLFVSMEMSKADILRRSVTGRAKVSAYEFANGTLSQPDRRAVAKETNELVSLGQRLWIEDGSDVTVQKIDSLLRSLLAQGTPIDLCVIDYLQLLHSVGRFENRVQEVSAISRGLKKIAQRFAIPVLALSQLSRQEDHKKHDQPELHWLKESGQLEQDADQVIFLWLKKDPQEGEIVREISWRVAKNRDGILNRGTLNFQTKYCRFDEDGGLEDSGYQSKREVA
jgi:replicative DNA helicase